MSGGEPRSGQAPSGSRWPWCGILPGERQPTLHGTWRAGLPQSQTSLTDTPLPTHTHTPRVSGLPGDIPETLVSPGPARGRPRWNVTHPVNRCTLHLDPGVDLVMTGTEWQPCTFSPLNVDSCSALFSRHGALRCLYSQLRKRAAFFPSVQRTCFRLSRSSSEEKQMCTRSNSSL